jgi:hypothetical protein
MIQRIQTLWLLLCALCASLAFILPFGTSFVSEIGTERVDGEAMNALKNQIVTVPVIMIIINCLVAIFLYKKRPIQILLAVIAIFLIITCIGLMVYLAMFETNGASLSYGIVAPVLALIFGLFALKGIRKDEKLVKNLDRLR